MTSAAKRLHRHTYRLVGQFKTNSSGGVAYEDWACIRCDRIIRRSFVSPPRRRLVNGG